MILSTLIILNFSSPPGVTVTNSSPALLPNIAAPMGLRRRFFLHRVGFVCTYDGIFDFLFHIVVVDDNSRAEVYDVSFDFALVDYLAFFISSSSSEILAAT